MPHKWLDTDTVVLDFNDDLLTVQGDSAVTRFRQMANASNNGEYHWFDQDAMRFFHTRLHRGTIRRGVMEFFVSSERNDPDMPWRYTVRAFNWQTNRVETMGEFRQWSTFDYAWELLEDIAWD